MIEIHDPASSGWHLDKRIPLALILVLVTQFTAGIWWMSALSGRVTRLEQNDERVEMQTQRAITSLAVQDAARNLSMGDLRDRLIRQETTLSGIEKKLDRIVP